MSREYFIEFYPVGQQVKVTAICAQTGVEVSIVGPASASPEILKQQAVKKLEFVKSKKG